MTHTETVRSVPEVTMSVSDVAERLRRTPGQILDLIEEGQLRFAPTTDIDDIRVPESALAEFLAHHREAGRTDDDDST
jgi:hypothetical protein